MVVLSANDEVVWAESLETHLVIAGGVGCFHFGYVTFKDLGLIVCLSWCENFKLVGENEEGGLCMMKRLGRYMTIY